MQPLHSHPKHAMEEQFLHFLHPSRFLTSFKALPRSTQRAVITWSNNSLIEFTPFSAANLVILLQIPKRETVPAFNHPQLMASRLPAYLSHDDWRRRLGQAEELGECPGRTKPLGRSRRGDLRQQPGYWQETRALTPFLKSSVNFATSTPQGTPILSISSIPPIARQFQL